MSDWTPKCLNPVTAERRGTSIADFFKAACELDLDWVEMILDKSKLDVNSVYTYGQTRGSNRPDYHMLQNFNSAKAGKVTMQIFETIDIATESDVNTVLKMMQLLINKGLEIEDVIYDKI